MLRLLRSRRALAGMEFAVIAPFLIVVLLGVADLSRAILMTRRLTVAANEIATIASTEAVQSSNLNVLTGYQAYAATTAAFALFPSWMSSPVSVGNSFSITLSEVNFAATPKGCTTNCGYTANVSWSVANPAGQARLRGCGPLTSVPNDSPSSLTTLPVGAFSSTSVLVADVSQIFVPLFTSVFLGNITFQRTAFVSPRVNNAVTLLPGYAGPVVMCPAAGS